MNVFITSDNHFYHRNIIRYCKRPFKSVREMNETMVKRWNRTISKTDLVFHLGDFALSDLLNIKRIRSQLNGTIILVLGNHDRKRILMKAGIIVAPSIIRLNNIVLTHRPLPVVHEGVVNVHGHKHNLKTIGRRINACVDVTNYEPVRIEKYFKDAERMLR